MKLDEIKPGMEVKELIGNEVVRIVSIKETKHYGPLRSVRVRFQDGHYEFYSPEDLEIMIKYSFCENAGAGPMSKWHIRPLTDKGRKLGGGADTLALCGWKVNWDVLVELTEFHLKNNACKKCLKVYEDEIRVRNQS